MIWKQKHGHDLKIGSRHLPCWSENRHTRHLDLAMIWKMTKHLAKMIGKQTENIYLATTIWKLTEDIWPWSENRQKTFGHDGLKTNRRHSALIWKQQGHLSTWKQTEDIWPWRYENRQKTFGHDNMKTDRRHLALIWKQTEDIWSWFENGQKTFYYDDLKSDRRHLAMTIWKQTEDIRPQ